MRWERERQQALALWSAGLTTGVQIPSPDSSEVWEEFNTDLARKPAYLNYSRDELALRRVLKLGVA